jgi:quercetin dioxygenase-like cupin family protein
MDRIDRRSALALGIAAGSAVVISARATAQGAKQGKEIAPGVHVVELSKRDSMVPGYKTVSMRDIVYQPKAKSSNPSMPNDMVCHCPQGELRVKQSNGHEFTVKQGDVWSCNKGLGEDLENIGSGVAIMRVIDLLPA